MQKLGLALVQVAVVCALVNSAACASAKQAVKATADRGDDDARSDFAARIAALEAEGPLHFDTVDPSRVQMTSFGEEHPAVAGHDDGAWAMNRRDEFLFLLPESNTAPVFASVIADDS